MLPASLPRFVATLAASGAMGACAHVAPSTPAASITASASTTSRASAAHALNRLTFGPRPGDLDRVLSIGVERWIDRQLHAAVEPDTAAMTALAGCPQWTEPVQTAGSSTSSAFAMAKAPTPSVMGVTTRVIIVGNLRVITRDSARRGGLFGEALRQNGLLFGCRLTRAEASDQQLREVMTDFWENHFSIHGDKIPTRASIFNWDRAVIRPRALGRFRDLLGAVAHSPAMLKYLDNDVSGADSAHLSLSEYVKARASHTSPVIGARTGLNENYARELLELHSLGVDAGYTQTDIVEVARALTGWSHSHVVRGGPGTFAVARLSGPSPVFVFDSSAHDADPKVVLGSRLGAGRGVEDGDDVLDLLARHPSTARYIARKLAVRFVSDTPPVALIERAAATFLRTDGDIREVVRTIVTSSEFFSPDVFGTKVKSPVELVLSMRRALGAPVDTAAESIDFLIALEQPPFGRLSPEGWPETGAAWMNVGTMRTRIEIANRVAQSEFPSIPVEAWPAWNELSTQPFDRQVDGVIGTLLSGQASGQTRAALIGARPATDSADARLDALRGLIALALASPEFQRR